MSYPGIEFQPRDFEILRGLFESRVMTLSHLSRLYFEGRQEAAKKRIQKLKAVGVIGERKRKVYEPSVLFLTRKSFAVLSSNGILADYPKFDWPFLEKRARVSDLTLRHELEVMDVKAALCDAIRTRESFKVAEFSTWPLLYQFRAMRPSSSQRGNLDVEVKPDGFIRIHERDADDGTSEHTFFLEVDRSTETQDTLALRAACYVDYYKAGGLAVRNGQSREAFKEFPFRVLVVCKTAERRNNAAERMLQINPPIYTQVMLTTLKELEGNPMGAIWVRPIDYRDVTKGTAFDTERKRETWGYKTQPEREMLVEKAAKKVSLFC